MKIILTTILLTMLTMTVTGVSHAATASAVYQDESTTIFNPVPVGYETQRSGL